MIRLQKNQSTTAPCRQFPAKPLTFKKRNGHVPTLVLRLPNWLGDAVMTLPAVSVLSRMMQELGGRLAVVATPQSASLARCLDPGVVQQVVAISGAHRKWTREEMAAIRALGGDYVLLFTNSLRDVLQFRKAGIRRLAGARARMRGIFMERSFSFPRRRRHKLNPPHHANRYLAMAYALGAPEWDGKFPVLTPVKPFELINREIAALTEHPSLLLLAAGAAYGAGKRWPSLSYREVAAAHVAGGGIVAVLGSPAEAVIGREIVEGLPETKVFNLCGKTDFSELIYLMKSARCMVANDSGLMHLGAALGVPGVAVFGPTDHEATGPVPAESCEWVVLTDPAPCTPCFRRTCKSGLACIARVKPQDVIAELKRF